MSKASSASDSFALRSAGRKQESTQDGATLPPLRFNRRGTIVQLANKTSFLDHDLDVSRLNAIHRHLWWAGRPAAARSLTHQVALNRQLVVTEQADLHLVWNESSIFLKPLPAYVLELQDIESNSPALSLLVSYIWLIRHQSDFKIAQRAELQLVQASLTWSGWTEICEKYSRYLARFDLLEPRYQYGELRLSRLNWIYILTGRSGPRGYDLAHNRVGSFFVRNFGWLAGTFAYLSIVLSAMQVGLGVDRLQNSASFQDACFGFAVFTLVSLAALVMVLALVFLAIFVSNIWWARRNNLRVQLGRGVLPNGGRHRNEDPRPKAVSDTAA
jgi:hypothetical protein